MLQSILLSCVLSLPGGDPARMFPPETPVYLEVENPARILEEGRDLHELHALMAPRPFFVSGGSEDPPGRWRAQLHGSVCSPMCGPTWEPFSSTARTRLPT